VGGGLQSALLVLAIRERQPTATIAVFERDQRLGGNHTWCFHSGDFPVVSRKWSEPLVSHRWNGYEVRFTGFERTLEDRYSCILPERLDQAVSAALVPPAGMLFRSTEVAEIHPTSVVLADGGQVRARLVVDARGPGPLPDEGAGFQKFVGQELELEQDHGLEHPVLMDATVDQEDGFRFFYLLPFGPRRLLVEDTRFTSGPELDVDEYRREIDAYCEKRGWIRRSVEREETGVLPMPWTGSTPEPTGGALRAGYRGEWFHPATGYSLAVAARLAEAVASRDADEVRENGLHEFWQEHERQRGYCQFLNRLLFRWYPPEMRWHVFARFYRLASPLIRRFYAMELQVSDQARLLVGRPPRGMSVKHRIAGGGDA
jgi:lycopene beta-cyclase